MANLPENSTYQKSGVTTTLSPAYKGYKYTPRTTYQNLAQLNASGSSPFTPAPPAVPGTFEYDQAKQAKTYQYGSMLNNGQGIATETPFLPPIGDLKTPIPIPSDYGSFAEPQSFTDNGEKLSWGTPVTPVIKNFPGGGQYVQDTTNPNTLIKTVRGKNTLADDAIRNGRPGFMYQIDHIIPLELGGADTLANRQLLTADQNDLKTRANAVPYTLYAHGDITLNDARLMAMQWKDKDVTDIPQPNNIGLIPDTSGKTGIQIAREAVSRWGQPKKVTFKDVMAGIPEAAKDLGKDKLPDPIREFIKGFGSGATLGFLPYEQGADEGLGSKVAGIAGMVAGGVASFMLGGELVDGALALSGMARGAIAAYRGVATAKAVETGLATAEEVANATNVAKTAQTTFKTLNKVPGYLKNLLTPETVARSAKFGVTSAVMGQAGQFVQNKFNPSILSGQTSEKDQTSVIGNIFKDLSLGALYGVGSPTIKGTAYATMLPLTLSYLGNPDDPVGAITNGVIFGAMHAVGTSKLPGYNNLEMFGGKPYENPVTKAFEGTVNKAAYQSLKYYAPEILPEVKPGEVIPTINPETVQNAKDTAIQNVWSRFFFDKDTTPEVQQKTLSDFKGFSDKLNADIESLKTPKLSFLEKFSLGARKTKTATVKAQNKLIEENFGKDYQKKNAFEGDTSNLPDVGMDLQTALTEIKRITVASRQLYKGNLTGELRNKADVDDLLSFGKNQLQSRFAEQEKFVNPPSVKKAVDSIDESFMQNSFNNDAINPDTKFLNGTIQIPGLALSKNSPKYQYLFDKDGNWLPNVAPNIILERRPDTAPLWSMKNQLLSEKDIKSGNHVPDKNPQNAIQAFFVVKNPQTGAKEIIEGGFVASENHLGKINSHPGVQKYIETNGEKGMKPIDFNKDQISTVMDREGLTTLVVNLDRIATGKTFETGNPFVVVNVKDNNWLSSKALKGKVAQQEDTNPVSIDIAKVNSALNAKQKTEAIAKMNKKVVKPPSAYIPTSVTPVNPKTDRITVPREATRTISQSLEQSLDVASPVQVKENFQKNLGIVLENSQATDIFNKRNDLTLRDGVKIVVDAVNNGTADVATKLKVNFVKTYLESGALKASGGQAVLDMKLVNSNVKTPVRGIEENVVPPKEPSITHDSVTPSMDTSVNPKNREEIISTQRRYQSQLIGEKDPTTLNKLVELAERPENRDFTQLQIDRVLQENRNLINPDGTIPVYRSGPKYDGPMSVSLDEGFIKAISQKRAEKGLDPTISKDNITRDQIITITPSGNTVSEKELIIRPTVTQPPSIPSSITPSEPTQGSTLAERIVNKAKTEMPKPKASIPQTPIVDETNAAGLNQLELGKSEKFEYPVKEYIHPDWFPSKEPVPKPTAGPGEYSDFIKKGLATSVDENAGAHYLAKAFDKGLKDMLGPDYAKNPRLSAILNEYFTKVFFNEQNSSGREIMQTKGIVDARAQGDYQKEKELYSQRNKQLTDNPTGQGGSLSSEELANRGLSPNDAGTGFSDMKVIPWYQEEGMVGNLTRGEDLMSALFSDMPSTGAAAVRAVRKLFLGYGREGMGGLKQFILERMPAAKRSIALDKMVDEAVSADNRNAPRVAEEKKKLEEAEAQLPQLKNMLQRILKDIKDPTERANWETEDILQGNLKDVTDKIAKFSNIIEKKN